jgi:flagellar motor switch protein FliG
MFFFGVRLPCVIEQLPPAEVEELAQSAQSYVPMSPEDQQALLEGFRPHARRLAFYRGR